ncbi:VanZ like protein [Chromatocurvus halotolerans]|uniref:VanZ like protein n=2 Tax=Chromatocurvus halotolerans TaxID=1132028 RepID=A0A4R2KLL1_9GAMM|nr:VanZ like protein [Chromatocurvus halotolerans]
MPWAEAVEQFRELPFLQLSLAKRADWVANGILFFPLALFWLLAGSSLSPGHPVWRFVTAVLVVAALCILSISIEFTQLFFPQRTVSQNDIMAETVGAALGAMLWFARGHRILAALDRYLTQRVAGDGWTVALVLYGLGFLLYAVMPLDLFLSPAELYAKWQDGRINLLPFAILPDGFLPAAYAVLTDIAIWIPVPLLLLRSGFCRGGGVVPVTVLLAFALECAQLLVFSRFSDITDLFTAGIGAVLGASLVRRFGLAAHAKTVTAVDLPDRLLLITAAFLGWLLLLLLAFWYPFDFVIDRSSLKLAESRFLDVPFASYYYTTEFHALTEVLRKVLFMAPLGALASAAVGSAAAPGVRRWLRLGLWPAVVLLALGLEIGQLFLPEKTGKLTDFLLGCVGLALGRWLWLQLTAAAGGTVSDASHARAASRSLRSEHPVSVTETSIQEVALALGIMVLALVVAVLFVTALPGLPYNLRELVAGPWRLARGIGLVLVLIWLFSLPGIFLEFRASVAWNAVSRASRRHLLGPGRLVLLHAMGLWLLVALVFPRESIHDIVGSPTWGFLPLLELSWRFSGLACLFSAILWFTAAVARPVRKGTGLRARAFLPALVLSLAWAYIVVVGLAGTDNIVELLRRGGASWRFVLPSLYLVLLCGCGMSLADLRGASTRRIAVVLALTLVSGPLGYQLLDGGLENIIFKYDAVFTAMQFLLSADRDNYVPVEALYGRFLFAHYFMLLAISALQVSPWLWLARIFRSLGQVSRESASRG